MRSMAIEDFGDLDRLKPMDLPRPKPARGELLVRVVAAGVNPVDWNIVEGRLEGVLPHAFPLIPGWDVAGVIEELGEGTGRFRRGERVWAYARKPVVQWGCYAEYAALPEASVALMPTGLLFEEAAGVPLAALTAYQALLGKASPGQGRIVLVHAAAGGVGHFAVQLGRNAGARVLGTARATNHPFVLGLGAEAAIDYTQEDVRDAVRRHAPDGVDVVLDCVGGPALQASFDVLKTGGRLVSIVERPDPAACEAHRVSGDFVFVEPSGEQLKHLSSLVERGKLKPHISRILPLGEAAAALAESRAGHVRGKLVLAV